MPKVEIIPDPYIDKIRSDYQTAHGVWLPAIIDQIDVTPAQVTGNPTAVINALQEQNRRMARIIDEMLEFIKERVVK